MLHITALSHVYDNGVRALDDINLHLGRGLFGLLGPNGAGKSTLMRCIATLQTPTMGAIHFAGIDVIQTPQAVRRVLGYLPQDFGVYPRVSAYDLLDHLAVLKGLADKAERKAAVESLLVQVNLWDLRQKAVSSYSGGQRQRFGVAQALLGQPKLIIVDEPTAGLDPEERNRFLNLLSEVGQNVVVILSTHIVEDVAELCPNMAVLDGGRIVQQGDPQDLMDALIGRVFRKSLRREDLDEVKARLHVISTRLQGGRPLVHVLADETPGEGWTPVEPGLEDVYFSTLWSARRGDSARVC